jgi:Arc/MetJ-type ribon-helix-helix transcriptional regulator
LRTTLTVSLPKKMRREIGQSARALHLTESEFVRRALQDRLWEESFEASRRKLAPPARAQGIYTDEDVFKRVS